MSKSKTKRNQPVHIDVDELARAVDRLEGKLAPEDLAYLRGLTGLLLEVRQELLSSDATVERVQRLLRGVKIS